MNELLEPSTLPTQSRQRYFQTAVRRCYTTTQVRVLLADMPRTTFYRLRKQGQLPLIEVLPRLGRIARYEAAPIDRWLANRGR